MHYLLSRIVEWHGMAIYASVWRRTFEASRGTVLKHPYGQRDEPPDAKRVTEADRAGLAAEAAWTKRFL